MKDEHLTRIFRYIGGYINSMPGHVYKVGGCPDHVHILAALPISVSLADFVRGIKANTSRWIKGIDSYYHDFSWQAGYGAFSVSESNKAAVINYINNQKEHHAKHTTQEEFDVFLIKHGILNTRCQSGLDGDRGNYDAME